MAKSIQRPRRNRTIGIDDGLPDVVNKYLDTKNLELKGSERMSLNDVWNNVMIAAMKSEGFIKKGDPLW